MERIAFVIPNLSGGGAARVASILLPRWIDAGSEVHLLTFESRGAYTAYQIDPRVIRHQLSGSVSPPGLLGFAANNGLRVARLRRCFRQIAPTVIVSFLEEANVATVLASTGLRVPVVISERNHPGSLGTTRLKALLRRLVYPRADRLCVQTADIRDWFAANLGIRASVIPNPVEASGSASAAAIGSSRPPRRAVALGRLEPQKGFDLLIDAFARIAADVPDWNLVIYGDGAARAELQRQIGQLGMTARIGLPGHTRHPQEELARADAYIHPARFEGYPNALLEALATGLCVVATDCPGATAEILHSGVFGILVPNEDVTALADAMRRVMTEDEFRLGFAARAREAVRPIAPETVARRWLEEFATCRRSGGSLLQRPLLGSRPTK